jgi:hypothetical protein
MREIVEADTFSPSTGASTEAWSKPDEFIEKLAA